LLVARAEAESPECPKWREAFAGMPFKMVTIQAGGKTFAVRAKWADTVERLTGGFQCATAAEIQRTLILFDFGEDTATQPRRPSLPAPLGVPRPKPEAPTFPTLRLGRSPPQSYAPTGPYRYALQARPGFYESQGIRQGEARVVIPAPR